jgi:hypothetical protein
VVAAALARLQAAPEEMEAAATVDLEAVRQERLDRPILVLAAAAIGIW